MIDRRTFVKGLTVTAAGLLVPAPGLVPDEEVIRRFWALDRTMGGAVAGHASMSYLHAFLAWHDALRDQSTPFASVVGRRGTARVP